VFYNDLLSTFFAMTETKLNLSYWTHIYRRFPRSMPEVGQGQEIAHMPIVDDIDSYAILTPETSTQSYESLG
jgi:hypothetical protein